MPAPAVYVLAVVGTIGAAFAFKHFVYEPHIAPKVEQWVEELAARRRARRMQQQGPIPVPASSPIPLRRRRGSRRSDTTLSDSSDGFRSKDNHSGSKHSSLEFDDLVASEVIEWRSQVEHRTVSGLRHRNNLRAHALDESINPVPHSPMSPTHVITDTSAPTTPTTASLPSRLPSPPPQISPLHVMNSESTLYASTNNGSATPSRPSSLSQVNTISPVSTHVTISYPTPTSPSRSTPPLPGYSPPSFSSPIPSLSQSYPQELDQEQGVELLSPPSSGTSSPFTTLSPFVAPQSLSPYATIQPLDDPSPEVRSWSSSPVSRALSPYQNTITSTAASNYQSFASSPAPAQSHLSSPVNVSHNELRPLSPHELSYLSSPSPINFTSPHALSPRSPHSDISDFDFGSDVEVISEPGSDISWAGVSSASGSSAGRR